MNWFLKYLMLWRIPRGNYCYKITKVLDEGCYEKKNCPFFEWIEKESQTPSPYKGRYGRCNWLDVEDDPNLNDQCKICYICENPLVFSFA